MEEAKAHPESVFVLEDINDSISNDNLDPDIAKFSLDELNSVEISQEARNNLLEMVEETRLGATPRCQALNRFGTEDQHQCSGYAQKDKDLCFRHNSQEAIHKKLLRKLETGDIDSIPSKNKPVHRIEGTSSSSYSSSSSSSSSKARKLEGGKEKIDWVDGGFGNEGEEKFDVEIDPGVSGSSSSSSSSSSNKNIISSSTSIDHHQQKKQRKR